MPSTQSERPPLARLVLFMVCLSIAGAFIAGVHYAVVDLPQQQPVTAPENFDPSGYCESFCHFENQGSGSYNMCYLACIDELSDLPMV